MISKTWSAHPQTQTSISSLVKSSGIAAPYVSIASQILLSRPEAMQATSSISRSHIECNTGVGALEALLEGNCGSGSPRTAPSFRILVVAEVKVACNPAEVRSQHGKVWLQKMLPRHRSPLGSDRILLHSIVPWSALSAC